MCARALLADGHLQVPAGHRCWHGLPALARHPPWCVNILSTLPPRQLVLSKVSACHQGPWHRHAQACCQVLVSRVHMDRPLPGAMQGRSKPKARLLSTPALATEWH
jgi:hypothetical protein